MLPLHVIIPAAGMGARMGAGLPKLLLELVGVPIILRTLRKFIALENLKQIVVTVPREYFNQYQILLEPESEKVVVIVGGATRKESVGLALQKISEKITDPKNEVVMVHDGARCFVSDKVINNALNSVEKYHAVTVAIPVIDSIKRVSPEGIALESLKRSELWAIQTPQIFKFFLLEQAHKKSTLEATDDASMVEEIHPVYIVEGEAENIKVTTPFDLSVAKAILGE